MSADRSFLADDLLAGTYDCVDRIVLNAYDPLCYSPGGFRTWWRWWHGGSDEDLSTAQLMRLAGRFARRVRAFGSANDVPVIDCKKGERKHEIAEEYLREHPEARGVFLILIARAVASVWEVERTRKGTIRNLTMKQAYVNHYSFHILDAEWGHVTIKMSGHPPFGAQVMLNGHEYVACGMRKQGLPFTKEGNCFTATEQAAELAKVADTLSEPRTIGCLSQLCDRWIYSACLRFGLDLAEQEASHFRYEYSVYQIEYSRNLLFKTGQQMEKVFQDLVDRNRARLDLRHIRTIFGTPRRRAYTSKRKPRVATTLERPAYSLTVFKLHFGKLTFKGYTKGERVLRFEAIAHNTSELGCGRVIAKFPSIVARLKGILERALNSLHWIERAFIADDTLEYLPAPSQVGKTRVGGIDIARARMRMALTAVLALAVAPLPRGFSVGELAAKVRELGGPAFDDYDSRRAAYDLKKLRGKHLVSKLGRSRRYDAPPEGLRTIAALVILREKVLKPLLTSSLASPTTTAPIKPKLGPKPKDWTLIDEHYRSLALTMQALLADLHLAAA